MSGGRKGGKRGGILVRLKTNANRPLIPFLFQCPLSRQHAGPSTAEDKCFERDEELFHTLSHKNMAKGQHARFSLSDLRPAALPCRLQLAMWESPERRLVHLCKQRLVHKLCYDKQPRLWEFRTCDFEIPSILFTSLVFNDVGHSRQHSIGS